jgi:type I restriction enzyme S subunit
MNESDLPPKWKIRMLGEKAIARTKSGGTPNRSILEYYGGDIPWVKSGELNDNYIFRSEEKITLLGLQKSSAKIFPKDTLLIALYGATAGKTAILKIEASTNQAICAIFPVNDSFDSVFLQYYLIHVRPKILGARSGRAQPNISQRVLSSLEVVLPPIPEQRAIARSLRAVQDAREARLRELALERERKAALMEQLFTRGTRGEATKMTEIGEMPESWTTQELGNIAEIQSGGTPLRSHLEYYNGTINWVKTLDLNDGIVSSTEEKITDLGYQAIRGKIRPVDSVMVAMYGGAGTVGKSGILSIPATTNQAVCCIEPNPKKFDSFYLLDYLIHIRANWMRYAIGTRKDPNISKGIIESMEIPLPPLDEQNEIADIFKACDSKIAALENEARLHDELFRAMLEELMSGRLPAGVLAEDAA